MNSKAILALILALFLGLPTPIGRTAIQGGEYHFLVPTPPDAGSAGVHAFFACTIDAANEKCGMRFMIRKTGTINKIGFRTMTVTTGATLDVRLETVSATTGFPSGSLVGTNTNVSFVVNAADDNVFLTATLTSGASVTVGDYVAVVISNPGASFGNMQLATNNHMGSATSYNSRAYNYLINTGSWASGSTPMSVALEYDDGSYVPYPDVLPIETINAINFSSSSTPDERGIKFRFPFPVKVIGFWAWVEWDENVTIKLYDSDGSTVLASRSVDKDWKVASTREIKFGFFSSAQTLTKDTYYRLTYVPDTTTAVDISEIEVDSAAVMDAFEGGQDIHTTERTDAGSWTDDTVARVWIGLIIEGFDDGASGGSSTDLLGVIQ
jgi:hypothetical protein